MVYFRSLHHIPDGQNENVAVYSTIPCRYRMVPYHRFESRAIVVLCHGRGDPIMYEVRVLDVMSH